MRNTESKVQNDYIEDIEPEPSLFKDLFVVVVVTSNAIGLGYLLTIAASHTLLQPKMAPWLLARASGLTAYLLLWSLVMSGLLLAHPLRSKFKILHAATQMRIHTLLAVFTLSFTTLHILSVILDSYANVGLAGAFIPFGSKYRSVPVGLGTLGLYAALITGLSARFKIGMGKKGWLNIHRFSIFAIILIWIHAVFAGTDSPKLSLMYLITAGILIAFGLSRYSIEKSRPNQPRVGAKVKN